MMWMLALAAHPATPTPVLERLFERSRAGAGDRRDVHAPRVLEALAANPALPRDLVAGEGPDTGAGSPRAKITWRHAQHRALGRPDMDARTARALLAESHLYSDEVVDRYEAACRSHTAPAVRNEILRAFTTPAGRVTGSSASSAPWHRILADPALSAQVRLALMRAVADSPTISEEQLLALAYTLARHPRHTATCMRIFKARQRAEQTTTVNLRSLIALPWLTTEPSQWTEMVTDSGLFISRAELISATGSQGLVSHALATNPTAGEARQILFHRHLPLPMRQSAATLVRDTQNLAYPVGALRDVLLDSDLAWSEQFLAGANDFGEAEAATHLAGLSAGTLARLLSLIGTDVHGRAPRSVVRGWAYIAAAADTDPSTREKALDCLRDYSINTAARDLVLPMGSGTPAQRGSRVPAGGELPASWSGEMTGDGELDAALVAFVGDAAPRLNTAARVEALFMVAPTFTGTLAELFDTVEAIAT